MDCAMQVDGDVNDNANGTVQYEFPDRFGNVLNLVTAEVLTAGDFGGKEGVAQSTGSASTTPWYSSELPQTGVRTASGGPRAMTASGGTAASTGAAAGFGVDAVRLVGLTGGAALAAW